MKVPSQEPIPNKDTCQAILAQLTEVQKERRRLRVHEAVPDGKSQEQLDHYCALEDQAEELEARLLAAAEQEFPLKSSDGVPIQDNRGPRMWLEDQIDDLRALPHRPEREVDPEWVKERDRLRTLDRKDGPGLSSGQLSRLATLEYFTRPDDATGEEVDSLVDGMMRAGSLECLEETFRDDPANLEAFMAERQLSPEQMQRIACENAAEFSWPEALPRHSLEYDPDAPAPVADLLGVFYSDKVNWLYGLPGCGKNWLALQAAKELAERGLRVIWIDAEDSLRVFRERLAALGVSPQVLKQIRWVDGDQWKALSDEERRGAIGWMNCPAGHVFIDAAFTTGAGESAESLAAWCPLFLLAQGTTVIDHIPKRREDRPPGPIGSVQKFAAITGSAVLMVAGKGAWTRDAPGQAKLILQKDRPGAIGPAMTLAGIAHGTPDLGRLKITVEKPPAGGGDLSLEADQEAVEAVKQFLRDSPGASTRTLRQGIKGVGNARIDAALNHLKGSGQVATELEGSTRKHYLHDDPEGGEGAPPHLPL